MAPAADASPRSREPSPWVSAVPASIAGAQHNGAYNADMCGRFSLTAEPRHIEKRFGAKFITTDWKPSYNAAPSQMLPVILGRNPLGNSEHEIAMARWGFRPSWAKNWQPQMNARVETAAEKPMFRHAFRSWHCLVLADGYYEWKNENGKKQPYRFVLRNREPFAMAGIWEQPQFDEEPATFAILTTKANDLAARVHDRMPIILPISYEHRWLTETGTGAHLNLPLAYPAAEMRCYPVTPRMNNARFNEADAIAPLEPAIAF